MMWAVIRFILLCVRRVMTLVGLFVCVGYGMWPWINERWPADFNKTEARYFSPDKEHVALSVGTIFGGMPSSCYDAVYLYPASWSYLSKDDMKRRLIYSAPCLSHAKHGELPKIEWLDNRTLRIGFLVPRESNYRYANFGEVFFTELKILKTYSERVLGD